MTKLTPILAQIYLPVEEHGQRRCRLIGLKISDFGGGSEELEPENILIAIRHAILSHWNHYHKWLVSRDRLITSST